MRPFFKAALLTLLAFLALLSKNGVTRASDPALEPGFPVQTVHTSGEYRAGLAVNTLVGNIDADPKLQKPH